jgi:serine/threonine protein kinase
VHAFAVLVVPQFYLSKLFVLVLKSRHIVHRDLKPGNIVVRLLPGGRVGAFGASFFVKH